MQFEKTQVSCLRQAVCSVQNQEQTQELRVPESMPDVGRVIAAWGQPILRSKQWNSTGIQVSGGVMCWVLYEPEDGSEPAYMEAWIPFQARWDIPESEQDGTIRVCCRLRSVDGRVLTARRLMLRAGIALQAQALVPDEISLYTPGQVPEDVALLRSTYPLELPREAGEKTLNLEEELVLPAAVPPMKKTTALRAEPMIQDQKVVGNKAVFRGSLRLHVLYFSDAGKLCAWDGEYPFSQFAQLDGEYSEDARLSVVPEVTSLEMESGEEGSLTLKCGITGQYVVYDRTTAELVEDAYSPRREVKLSWEELDIPACLDRLTMTVPMEQTIQSQEQPVDLVVLSDLPRAYPEENGLRLEQSGTFMSLQSEDGAWKTVSTRWESSTHLNTGEDTRVTMWPGVGSVQVFPSGGGITIRKDFPLEVTVMGTAPMSAVSGLELGELREPAGDRPSLIVRRLSGEDGLWSLAKCCGSSVEAIRKANGLQGEPEPERLLLIPVL